MLYGCDSIAELVVFHASGSAYLQNGTTVVLAIPTSQGELWADLQMANFPHLQSFLRVVRKGFAALVPVGKGLAPPLGPLGMFQGRFLVH